jgi:sortase A
MSAEQKEPTAPTAGWRRLFGRAPATAGTAPGLEQDTESEAAGRKKTRSWRRLLANLLILAGLGLLLYPVGTWGYAWYEQRQLESQLEEEHPVLAGDARAFFTEMIPAQETQEQAPDDDAESKARAREAAEKTAFKAAAEAFAAENKGRSGPIGKILIPEIGVDSVLIHGTGRNDLREGPGHWPETPMPGLGGNFVISGHRTTYGAPFMRLDKLQPGDEIDVLLPYVAARYRVVRSMIVKPDEVQVVSQRGLEEISLATCHPIYSARERLVVQADLISFKLLGEAAEAAETAAREAGASP